MAIGKYAEWLEPDGLLRLEAWARDGLTDEQIASNMGISTATLYNYKRDHVDILESLKRGKEVVDIAVENALFKRAMGYEYNEVTQEVDVETGNMRVTRVVTRQVSPDTTAQIFWLKNRKPAEWRDRKDVAVDGTITTHNPFSELTTEQLKKLAGDC